MKDSEKPENWPYLLSAHNLSIRVPVKNKKLHHNTQKEILARWRTRSSEGQQPSSSSLHLYIFFQIRRQPVVIPDKRPTMVSLQHTFGVTIHTAVAWDNTNFQRKLGGATPRTADPKQTMGYELPSDIMVSVKWGAGRGSNLLLGAGTAVHVALCFLRDTQRSMIVVEYEMQASFLLLWDQRYWNSIHGHCQGDHYMGAG